jgi:hypothetical protein
VWHFAVHGPALSVRYDLGFSFGRAQEVLGDNAATDKGGQGVWERLEGVREAERAIPADNGTVEACWDRQRDSERNGCTAECSTGEVRSRR